MISVHMVAMDPEKISIMVQWSTPSSVKALKGCLGLRCYYRKFIQGYGSMARLQMQLLKKHAFEYTEPQKKPSPC